MFLDIVSNVDAQYNVANKTKVGVFWSSNSPVLHDTWISYSSCQTPSIVSLAKLILQREKSGTKELLIDVETLGRYELKCFNGGTFNVLATLPFNILPAGATIATKDATPSVRATNGKMIRLRNKGSLAGVKMMCPTTLEILLAYARHYINPNITKIVDVQLDEVLDLDCVEDGETLFAV